MNRILRPMRILLWRDDAAFLTRRPQRRNTSSTKDHRHASAKTEKANDRRETSPFEKLCTRIDVVSGPGFWSLVRGPETQEILSEPETRNQKTGNEREIFGSSRSAPLAWRT